MNKSVASNGASAQIEDKTTPNELFKRMVDNDSKQNAKISKKSSNKAHDDGSTGITKTRFIVCTLGLLSLSLSQMSRMVLNVTITSMVRKAEYKKETLSMDGSCPWPEDEKQTTSTIHPEFLSTGFSTAGTQHSVLTTESTMSTTFASSASPTTTITPSDWTIVDELTPTSAYTTTHPPTTSAASTKPTGGQVPSTTISHPAETEMTSGTLSPFTTEHTTSYHPTIGHMDIETSYTTDPYFMDVTQESSKTTTPIVHTPSTAKHTLDDTIWSTTSQLAEHDTSAFTEATTTAQYGHQFLPASDTEMETFTSLNETIIQPVDISVDKFDWTIKQQNTVLGGFYYSYFVFMILGGRMAELYGSKYVLMLSVAGSAIINLATPWMARTSFGLLVFSRVVLGAIQAGVFPGMYALFAKWLTMSEASIYAPLIKVNLRLGMLLGSWIPGLLEEWPNVFYFTGSICFVWSILWFFLAESDPRNSSLVSRAELAHIVKKKKKVIEEQPKQGDVEMSNLDGGKSDEVAKKPKQATKTPWLKIVTAPSVIGLILVKFTFNCALDFIAIQLPTYLSNVFHLKKDKISSLTTPLYTVQVVLVVFVGWLAKHMVKTKPFGLSKTGVRKVFQALASYGVGLFLIVSTFNDCSLVFLMVSLHMVSFLSMFTAGGETMLPYDLSEEYPATIMAIANSVANLSGSTTTTVASFILSNKPSSSSRWNLLIYLIGGANFIGGLAFSLLVSAEPIDFSSSKKQKGPDSDLESINLNDVVVMPRNVAVPDKSVGVEPSAPPPEKIVSGQIGGKNAETEGSETSKAEKLVETKNVSTANDVESSEQEGKEKKASEEVKADDQAP